MKNPNLLTMLIMALLVPSGMTFAQNVIGHVTSTADGYAVPGVTVQSSATSAVVSTDYDGNYSLQLKPGKYTISFSHIGYETVVKSVSLGDQVLTLAVKLTPVPSALSEVAVLGSRSGMRTNIDSPVPIDVISGRELKAFPQTDITQILNYIAPSFSSNRQTVADGTDHMDPASLRGLGPDQVLVLVNGKRQHTSALVNINGTFGRGSVGTDLNSIPVAAIERIEVLRDGAAAQYGSDAIAGVINIVLKKVTPFSLSAMYGQTESHTLGKNYSDGRTYQLEGTKGWNLNGKGFLNVSAQYLDRGATNRGGEDTHPLIYSALPSKGATETEEDFHARFAALKAADDARAQANGFKRDNMAVGNSHAKNFGGFLNGEYALASWTNFYLVGGYSHRDGSAAGFIRLPNQSTQIDETIYPNGFLPYINTAINDLTLSGGFKGKFGKWNYDLSNAYGKNTVGFTIDHTLNASLPSGTSPTRFHAGKLIFSQNTLNFDVSKKLAFSGLLTALNMAYGAEYRVDSYAIEAGEELSYSFGQPSKNIPGRLVGTTPAAAGAQVFPGFNPKNAINKSRHNTSLYADYEFKFGTNVLLEAAGRYENFSDFGSNFSYKFTGKVKIADFLNLRASIATGFRAPSLAQRYFNNESTQFVASAPTQVLTVNNDHPIVAKFGVRSLKAEKSNAYSLGLTGSAFAGFTYTIDAYQIDIKDRIVFSSQFTRATPGVSDILNTNPDYAFINSVQFFTNAIGTRTKGLDIVLANRLKVNNASSLLLSASANFNQTKVKSVQGSDVIEHNAALKAKLFDRTERSRFESSVPASKFNFNAAYRHKKWESAVRASYFGKVTFLNAVNPTIAANNLPLELDQTFQGKWITDLSLAYQFATQLKFGLSVNNLFDIYPDKNYIDPRNNANNLSGNASSNYTGGRDNTSTGHFAYNRNVSQFGSNGRFVSTRITFTY
jgi:iron complex outermembrane receptor protein